MNRNGKVDIVALITIIMMIFAIVGLVYQFGRIDGIRSNREQVDTPKQTADAGKLTTFEQVEKVFRPNIVAARVEQRRLKEEIYGLVEELNQASEGLAAAIKKFNDTDSKKVEMEALAEQAGRLEAYNRLKTRYLEAITKYLQIMPEDQRQKAKDQLQKINSRSVLAQRLITESDDNVRKYISGKPDDVVTINKAIEAHRQAIRALAEVQQAYNSL